MWHKGLIATLTNGNKYKYWVKVYDEGSEFGINEGCISKLTIRKVGESDDLYNYDRGLDVDSQNDEVRTVLDIILAQYAQEAGTE